MLKCRLLVLIIMYLLPLFHVCQIEISFHTHLLLPSCVFLHRLIVPVSAALQITLLSKSQAWLHTSSSSVLREIIYEVIALVWPAIWTPLLFRHILDMILCYFGIPEKPPIVVQLFRWMDLLHCVAMSRICL